MNYKPLGNPGLKKVNINLSMPRPSAMNKIKQAGALKRSMMADIDREMAKRKY